VHIESPPTSSSTSAVHSTCDFEEAPIPISLAKFNRNAWPAMPPTSTYAFASSERVFHTAFAALAAAESTLGRTNGASSSGSEGERR
jgi:hypothetical protein